VVRDRDYGIRRSSFRSSGRTLSTRPGKFRGARGKEDDSDVLRQGDPACRVPAGPVEEQHGVGASRDGAGYLVEVELHGLHVGIGRGDGRAGSARRADGPKR